MNARAIDFARLGVLYLHRGNWGGSQLLPRSWVARSTSPKPAAPHYGYWWWLEPGGAFLARGNFGQFVFVDPRRDVVVARFGRGDADLDWPHIFSQVSVAVDGALPRGKGGDRRRER